MERLPALCSKSSQETWIAPALEVRVEGVDGSAELVLAKRTPFKSVAAFLQCAHHLCERDEKAWAEVCAAWTAGVKGDARKSRFPSIMTVAVICTGSGREVWDGRRSPLESVLLEGSGRRWRSRKG